MSLPPNVTAFPDRHGKIRHRFRKKGLRSRYLPGEPGEPAFAAAYQLCFDPSLPATRTFTIKRLSRCGDPYPAQFKGRSCVYFIGAKGGVKIGTTVNLPARIKKLQTGSPSRLKLLACVEAGPELEVEYHRRFASYRIGGEWFARRGAVMEEVMRLRKARSFDQPPDVQPRSTTLSMEKRDVF